jgi:hypothetical protein
MRGLAMGALLFLTGCASLSSDLAAAEAKCAPATVMTVYVTCLNAMDEPVWQKDSPGDAPAYRDFAAARLSLAQNLDGGKITALQFTHGTAQARAKFAALLIQNARARQDLAARQRTQQELEDMQKSNADMSKPDAGMGGNMGMGM